MKELIILSGPSGSGVSSSKFVFEELGYYVIDSAPSNVTQALLDEWRNRAFPNFVKYPYTFEFWPY